LGALRAESKVDAALLCDEGGKNFATYEKVKGIFQSCVSPPRVAGWDRLTVTTPVMLYGRSIGSIHLVANLQELHALAWNYLVNACLILCGSLLLALFGGLWLQGSISRPILDLVHAAREVSGHKDYSVRVSTDG